MTNVEAVAREVLALARQGIPFAEARAMTDDERQAYLGAFEAERASTAWKSGLPKTEQAPEPKPDIPGLSTFE